MSLPNCEKCDNNIGGLCFSNPPTPVAYQYDHPSAGHQIEVTNIRPDADVGCRAGFTPKEDTGAKNTT